MKEIFDPYVKQKVDFQINNGCYNSQLYRNWGIFPLNQ